MEFLLLRMSVGWVFVLSSLAKVVRPAEFRRALGGYLLLRHRRRLQALLVLVIPLLELSVGLPLALGAVGGVISLCIAGPLLLIFSYGVARNARAGIRAPCGCGPFQGGTTYVAILRNVFLLGTLAVSGLGLPWEGSLRLDISVVEWGTLSALASIVALIMLMISRFMEQFLHQLEHLRS